MEIVEFPHHIVYVVGKDTEVDLSGGKIRLTIRAGREFYHEMTEPDFFYITHTIDFYTEGVYEVEIRKTSELYVIFPVQVIQLEPEDEQ